MTLSRWAVSLLSVSLLFAWALAVIGCGGEDRTPPKQEAKPAEGTTAPSEGSAQAANEGPTAVKIQCGDCLESFDKEKMSEIGGRWYCEACAPKHR